MTDEAAICPCQEVAHPRVIDNPPGRSVIRYRAGDYASFRDALLRSLPDERELLRWRPTADGDLALQLLEWWAYLADVLTFYNEQIARGAYLGTAFLPGAVEQLVRLIGYRPRPGIGAHGTLAAIASGAARLVLPPGFAVQSKPGAPGPDQPKIFEGASPGQAVLPGGAGGVVPVDVKQTTQIHGRTSLLLRGQITSVKPGDVIVVCGRPATSANSQAVTITQLAVEKDPRGRTATRLTFTPALTVPDGDVTTYRVMRSDTFQGRYPFAPATTAITHTSSGAELEAVHVIATPAIHAPAMAAAHADAPDVADVAHPAHLAHLATQAPRAVVHPGPSDHAEATLAVGTPLIHLASVARAIGVGDLVLLEASSGGGPAFKAASVVGYREDIWYANATNKATAPDVAPTGDHVVALPVPHSVLLLDAEISTATTRVWFAFRPVGDLLDEPAGPTVTGSSFTFVPLAPLDPAAAIGRRVIVEDATGAGAPGRLTVTPMFVPPGEVRVTLDAAATLTLPLRLLFNLFDVTEGKTVTGEVLGDGDPTAAGQAFVLGKSPVTYLAGADPSFPTSTLRVTVDSIAWREVKSLFGQPADAQVFVTRQDADQKTHVLFGDGKNGARLPRGTGNVVASYRFGSGGPAPAQGSLVTIVKPVPGLGSVRNPVRVSGGDDPTPPAKIRRYAPRSVLNFGRAVSAADYEAIAANAPSVTRARAYYSWSALRQRASVVVHVGDDDGARLEAQRAIDAARDPNLPATVVLATPVRIRVGFTLAHDARFDAAAIQPLVEAALTGDGGMFSPERIRIGEPLYDSQIYAACLGVAGTLAVRNLVIADRATGAVLPGVRHVPGEGGFFTVAQLAIVLAPEVV
ncbi:MAG TPA: hypothetical protein VFK02_26395 [Kofleriaceae bacterium]|nr:hypothetical protein [Kofleriaceae bacterium]